MTNEQRIEPLLDYFGFSLSEMKSPSRNRELVVCRHFCMALLKKTTPMSLKSIAAYFNRIDHTTVIHALDNVEAFETDWEYKHHFKVFASIVAQSRGIVDQMPETIDMDQLYLPQLCEVGLNAHP
jgi:chromosomal replication initiation ATPase DnaA